MTAPADPPAPPPIWWSPTQHVLIADTDGGHDGKVWSYDAPDAWIELPADAVRLVPKTETHPTGADACTVCHGVGTVHEDGYYVPGEQFVEPPYEGRCEACVGSGQRQVQQIAAELIRLRAGAVPDTPPPAADANHPLPVGTRVTDPDDPKARGTIVEPSPYHYSMYRDMHGHDVPARYMAVEWDAAGEGWVEPGEVVAVPDTGQPVARTDDEPEEFRKLSLHWSPTVGLLWWDGTYWTLDVPPLPEPEEVVEHGLTLPPDALELGILAHQEWRDGPRSEEDDQPGGVPDTGQDRAGDEDLWSALDVELMTASLRSTVRRAGRMLLDALNEQERLEAVLAAASSPSGDTAPAATEHAFLRWLVSMDDPEDVIGREERRTVTLDQIIRRARALLGVPSSTRDGSETS